LSSTLSLQQVKTALLDLLFPLQCTGCGREGTLICPSCRLTLRRIEPPFCQRCGTPLGGRNRCASCVSHPLIVDGIRSLYLFEGTIRKAIHQFKYGHLKAMAAPLGEMLASYLRGSPLEADVIMPVPLHRKRMRERGYNQASLLAAELSRQTGLPLVEDRLVRQLDTAAQARALTAAERRRNVSEAFACTRELDRGRILLIDDVWTTGATLDACAAALKASGADSVWGLTVASEIFPSSSRAILKSGVSMA
jgi:ComF family protein